MSHVIEKSEISLQTLQELFSEGYESSDIEENTLYLVNEYGNAIMLEVDEGEGLIRWFCADKIRDDADELELARLCKKYNDSGELKCCYVGYDINDTHGIYVGASYELKYDFGLILEQLIATHRMFNESMLHCFWQFQELGYFPERTEI